jgi:DNA ligase-1
MKRERVMLAQVFNLDKHDVKGWWASEKLDGMRAIWDGGISRGMFCKDVPYANTEKDARLILPPRSTGLWSRLGKAIQAPDWWLDLLPPFPLDGELYLGRKKFQALQSICKDHVPGVGWQAVQYMVFDSPPWDQIVEGFVSQQFVNSRIKHQGYNAPYERVYAKLVEDLTRKSHLQLVPQVEYSDLGRLMHMLDLIVNKGGEGLMLRRPGSFWTPERSHNLLKVKSYKEGSGKVIGYTWGLGKYECMMGNMLVEMDNGKQFELSGFTDMERQMSPIEGGIGNVFSEGQLKAGKRINEEFFNARFPLGSKVEFKYRELSDAGIPKEARFHRV